MPWHTVAQGEWIQKIAWDNHFYNWEAIWNHAQNADLKQKRQDPNLLLPGDNLFIPDLEPKEVAAATDQVHKYVKKAPKMTINITVRDEDEHPLANKPWKLTLDGKDYSGNTDGDGVLKQEVPVPKSNDEGKLVCEGYQFPIRVGHLNPIDEISGVKHRLANLGFDCGSNDDSITPEFQDALKQFQQHADLDPTGEVNQATRDKLKETHKC